MCICGEHLTILNMMAADLESTALRARPKPPTGQSTGPSTRQVVEWAELDRHECVIGV
jgi:hypothetical protein